MDMQTKYADVFKLASALNMKDMQTQEREGKLHLKAQAPYQREKDMLWDRIKSYPDWQKELAADISVMNTEVYGYHTVQAGDTLSKLAERHLGDPKRYMEIFELNKDLLQDPNMIKPGQRLKLPRKSH